MYFQVEKIILWSKKVQYSYKTVNFCCDKINVITGASRTEMLVLGLVSS